MISVAGRFASAASGVECLNGAAVLTAQIIEIGNVVIRLCHEKWHVVLFAEGTRPAIGRHSTRKIVEANQADGHVAENDGDSFRVFVRQQARIGTLIVSDRFFKAILTVIDVADVDFQTGQPPGVVQTSKYLLSTLRGLKCLVVLARQDHRLDRSAQSSRGFVPITQRFI